jgi:glycosyltransferase involved in cell wall biosynthesis
LCFSEKNPGLLLQAAYHALKRNPFLRFRFIGDGILRKPLETLAKRLGIDYAVDFTGWVSSMDLPHYLADVDIILNPSLRGWSETFCISNIEAMSMGIPLITFGVGGKTLFCSHFSFNQLVFEGIGEYIQLSTEVKDALSHSPEDFRTQQLSRSYYDNRTQFSGFDIADNAVLLNSANPMNIADAIITLSSNPTLAKQLGENGRRSLVPYFSVERQMKQYENLYDAVFELLS